MWFHKQIEGLLSSDPHFKDRPYEDLHARIIKSRSYNCGGFSNALIKLGHRPIDCFYDMEWLQKKWAVENSIRFDQTHWLLEIAEKQIEKHKPDVLFFQQNALFPSDYLKSIKRRYPFIQKIVTHFAFLGDNGDQSYSDLLLVGTPGLVKRYEERGLKPRLFYHYFDEGILEELPETEEEKKYPVSFMGASGFGHGVVHSERYWLLRRLVEELPITMWLWEPDYPKHIWKKKLRDFLVDTLCYLPDFVLKGRSGQNQGKSRFGNLMKDSLDKKFRNTIQLRKPDKRLADLFPEKCHGPLLGMNYYRKMAESKISFHKHGNNLSVVSGKTSNDIGAIRLFEATGVGSCLLTDGGQNLKDLFLADEEVVTYTTDEEISKKIMYLLSNPNYLKSVAKKGQARTLKDHTATKRFQCLAEWLEETI